MSMQIAEITTQYLDQTHLTAAQFAGLLSISVDAALTRGDVQEWKRGTVDPDTDLLLQALMAYGDWRRSWALEVLRVKLPQVFGDPVRLAAVIMLAGETATWRLIGCMEAKYTPRVSGRL